MIKKNKRRELGLVAVDCSDISLSY